MTRLLVVVQLPPDVPPDTLLTESEAADLVGCRVNNLCQLRKRGTGPPYTLLGDSPDSLSGMHQRSALYLARDVLTWYRRRYRA